MPSVLPLGDPVPADGALPDEVVESLGGRSDTPFGLYVHIPFCSVRCGYCDFNTYTAEDLGPGASQATYADTLLQELDLARRVLDRSDSGMRPLATVFFGGGTPTLLPASDLAKILNHARELFGISADAEVTTEANPDTVTPEVAQMLADAGFTRLSLGMQSAVPHVLKTLDRTHDPENVERAVAAAKGAGLEVSLDLIYGTPGETADDWQKSLDHAVSLEPDHISAYSLIIEDGTAMARQIKRGEIADIDSDDQADKYLMTERTLNGAGFSWYEVSNYSRSKATQSQHNLHYWLDTDWWGAGPGAHSHVSGLRWWNVKHPAAYASRLASHLSPGHGREILSNEAKVLEFLMLRIRTYEGLDVAEFNLLARTFNLTENLIERPVLDQLAHQGLIESSILASEPGNAEGSVIRLTLQGRLLADAVTRRLAGMEAA